MSPWWPWWVWLISGLVEGFAIGLLVLWHTLVKPMARALGLENDEAAS